MKKNLCKIGILFLLLMLVYKIGYSQNKLPITETKKADILNSGITEISSTTNINPQSSPQVDPKSEVIIGTGTAMERYPIYALFDYSYSQSIYLQSEINQAGPITKISFYFNGTSLSNSNNWTIYLGHTSKSTFNNLTDWVPVGSMTQVYSGTFTSPTAPGWIEFNITPFTYNNVNNLVIAVDENAPGINTTTDRFYSSATTGTRSIVAFDAANINPVAPPLAGYFQAFTPNIKLMVSPFPNNYIPELLYYKFENNLSSTSIKNCAIPGVGSSVASFSSLTLSPGGQFDTCIAGNGITGGNIVTGWNCNLAATNWTIGFWVKDLYEQSPGSASYLFGDEGNTFRCYYGGTAGINNLILKGSSLTQIVIPCPMPGSHYFHFVYDGTNVVAYMDGVFVSSNPRTINIPVGTGFTVAGYSIYGFCGKIDEFRLYNRALFAAEIAASWNIDVVGCGTVSGINPDQSTSFELTQNYPNPFNQYTFINYKLSANSDVMLKVFDIMGKEVKTLVNSHQHSGKYEVKLDARDLSPGVYIYQLTTNNKSVSKLMILER